MLEPVAHVLAQRRRHVLAAEAQEHEPAPQLAPDRLEPERLEAEVLEVLGVLGPDETAVEVVDPGVVRALEADGLATLALLDRGPPVATHVVERADDVVLAADEEDALAEQVPEHEAPRLRDLLGPADRDPVAEEVPPRAPTRTRPRRGRPSPGAASPCGTGRGCPRSPGPGQGRADAGPRSGRSSTDPLRRTRS